MPFHSLFDINHVCAPFFVLSSIWRLSGFLFFSLITAIMSVDLSSTCLFALFFAKQNTVRYIFFFILTHRYTHKSYFLLLHFISRLFIGWKKNSISHIAIRMLWHLWQLFFFRALLHPSFLHRRGFLRALIGFWNLLPFITSFSCAFLSLTNSTSFLWDFFLILQFFRHRKNRVQFKCCL